MNNSAREHDGNAASQPTYRMLVEKDVNIAMRDGTVLKGDLLRPDSDERFPVLVNQGFYQKDRIWVPPSDLDEKANPFMAWETVNPEWWVPRGYCLLRVDARGSGKSPGQTAPYSLQESVDFYDIIEWAARQSWSSGNVGTIGISYYARTQWWVANLKPPSLKAMIPWEGAADQYRDVLYHGGLFSLGFLTTWFTTHMAHHLLGRASRYNPDTFQENFLWRIMRHNLDTGAFRTQQAQWDQLETPFLAVGNWTGMGLHLRGATEAYMRAVSANKKLRIHTGTHFHSFYTEDGRRDQLRFFDYWLKGIDNGVMDEPPVRLWIRHGDNKGEWRYENEWPIERTRWTKYNFDLSDEAGKASGLHGMLVPENPPREASRTYPAGQGHASTLSTSHAAGVLPPPSGISLITPPLDEALEVTGPIVAVMWGSSTTEDMDVFVTLRNIGPDGKDILETGQQGQPVPVAKGWLRASHRELDLELSLPYRPYHKHQRRQYLRTDEVVQLHIEVWPTSMVFGKGHRIRIDIQPRDGVGSAPYTHYHADYNVGQNSIYSGGERESYLLLPVIPPR